MNGPGSGQAECLAAGAERKAIFGSTDQAYLLGTVDNTAFLSEGIFMLCVHGTHSCAAEGYGEEGVWEGGVYIYTVTTRMLILL